MAKASQLLKGKRAVLRVRFPSINLGCSLLPDVPELAEQRKADEKAWREEHPGEEAFESPELGLRVMTGAETADILEEARKLAVARGVADPKETDPLYELGRQVHTLLITCVDVDTIDSKSDPEPFFDSAEQILTSLGRDDICYLAEQQEIWQDQCSPQALHITTEQLWEMLAEVKGADGLRFFGQLRPGLRWSLVHFLANLLLTSQMLNSESSLPDDRSGTASRSGKRSTPSRAKRKTTVKSKAKSKARAKR